MLGAARRGDRPMLMRQLGLVDYLPTFAAMQAFTATRNPQTNGPTCLQPPDYGPNQLWICEHLPVYTQGLAGKTEHILNPSAIPVVQTDRGRQVHKTSRESS